MKDFGLVNFFLKAIFGVWVENFYYRILICVLYAVVEVSHLNIRTDVITHHRCAFLNLHMRIGLINRIFLLDLTCFPILAYPQQIMVILHQNWRINTIYRKWPWSLRFQYRSTPIWNTDELHFHLPLCLSWTFTIFAPATEIFGADYCEIASIFFVSSRREVAKVMKDNGK